MLRFVSGCNLCSVSLLETSRIAIVAFSFVSTHSFARAWPVLTSKDSESSSQRHCWLRMYSHSKHINSRTTTSAQRINTHVMSMKMIHEERTFKNIITPPPPHPPPRTPPTNTQRINTYVTSWKRMLTYSCICQRDVYVYSSICQPHTTPSSCCHEASRSGVASH